MRAIIWAAVSSRPQLKGDSLEAQIRDAQAVCERFGWTVIATLSVPGQSRDFIFFQDAAASIEAYREFETICGNGKADVLVCRGRDRLGRTDALIAQVEAVARQAGMQIYSIAMPSAIVEASDMGQDRGTLYAAAIERASAQAEMMELRRRHQMGMRARIRNGLPANSVPYGYTRELDTPVPVQVAQEVAIVRQMAELFLGGWGAARIAVHLTRQGVKPPRAEGWRGQSIRGMLRNRFYAGWVFNGDTVAPGKHAPIFSPQEWAQIQSEHGRRKQTRGRPAYPYSGLVRCHVCGRSMTATTTHLKLRNGHISGFGYYICPESTEPDIKRRAAKHRTAVRVERIRDAVLAKATELSDPDALDRACRDRTYKRREELETEKVGVERAMDALEQRVARLVDAHTHWGSLALEAFDQAMTEVAEHKGALQDALDSVEARLAATPPQEERARYLGEFAEGIGTVLGSSDVEEANAWLAKRIRAVWCEENRAIEVELV
jgi:site-specific DNA recombinase